MLGIQDPEDPTKVSFAFRRRMIGDHMIGLGLYLTTMPAIRAQWFMESTDARVAAFCDNLIRPIYGRLVLTLMRFLTFGFSPAVKRFEVINPDWVYLQDGEVKRVWDNGSVGAWVYRGITPLKPEICRPKWSASGDFDGIKYDRRFGDGFFQIEGKSKREVDLLHSIWATYDQEAADNSLYGMSRVARAAPIYHAFWYLWSLLMRGFENSADPGPVVRYPKDDYPITTDESGQRIKNVDTALRIGTRRRSGSTIAVPSELQRNNQDQLGSQPEWGIDYPEPKTDFEHMLAWLGQLEAAKLRAIFVPEMSVTAGPGDTSSRNVVGELSQMRDESQVVLMMIISELIEKVLLKPALAMNMPWFEGTVKMRVFSIGSESDEIVRQIFQLVGQQDWKSFGIDVKRIAESRGFPMLSPVEQQRQLVQSAEQQQQQPAPVIEPTQGRRALVTQTGFGEHLYVQLGDEPSAADSVGYLSDDGDFVAGLPQTDHFADKDTVALARELRRNARAYYKGLYEDFAVHLSKQRLVLADEEFADDPRKLASKIVASWQPRMKRTNDFVARVRRSLTKVVGRSARGVLDKLGSGKRSQTDKLASDWLEDHGAKMVAGVADTVRGELRDFLAREVREGTAVTDLATKLRGEFDSFPDWKADRLARTEVASAHNFATLSAGKSAGIKKVQALDGHDDPPCRQRNGRIFDIKTAFNEGLAHPNCTLSWRLLPQTDLNVVKAATDDGLLGRYDEQTQTILLASGMPEDEERSYLLALGARLEAETFAGEAIEAA